jgi:hypothetical protein
LDGEGGTTMAKRKSRQQIFKEKNEYLDNVIKPAIVRGEC